MSIDHENMEKLDLKRINSNPQKQKKKLKDGMEKIDWNKISSRVRSHRKCSIPSCYSEAEFMKLTKGKKKYYRIYCDFHAHIQPDNCIRSWGDEKVTRMPKFNTYDIYIDKNLKELIFNMRYVYDSIDRHRSGDYGITSLSDWEGNDLAVEDKQEDPIYSFVLSEYEYIDTNGYMIFWQIDTDFVEKVTKITLKKVIDPIEDNTDCLEVDASNRREDDSNRFEFHIFARDLTRYLTLDRSNRRIWIPFDLSKVCFEELYEGYFVTWSDGSIHEISGGFKLIEELSINEGEAKLQLSCDSKDLDEDKITIYNRKIKTKMREIFGKGRISTFEPTDTVKSVLKKLKQYKNLE